MRMQGRREHLLLEEIRGSAVPSQPSGGAAAELQVRAAGFVRRR